MSFHWENASNYGDISRLLLSSLATSNNAVRCKRWLSCAFNQWRVMREEPTVGAGMESEMVENSKQKRLLHHRCVCVCVHGNHGSGGKAIHSLMIGRLTGKNTAPPIASDEPGTHHHSELISMCAGEKRGLLKEVCPQLENSCDNVSPLELRALNLSNGDSWSSIHKYHFRLYRGSGWECWGKVKESELVLYAYQGCYPS